MADGSILIDTKIDETGMKSGLSSLTNKVAAGAAAITAALAAGTAAVVNYGSKFESSMAKASTLFGDVQVNTQGLEGDMLKLSNATGVAADQLGNSLYSALSAGIPVTEDMAESVGFLEQNAKLAKAGFTDIDTAMLATVSVLNGYKKDVSETADVQKMLMQIQNRGITTIGELGSVMSQVIPTAAAMNVGFDQVSAALATMTNQKIPAAQATTQLRQLFAELGKSGTQAQKGLAEATKGTEYAGLSFQDLMKKGVPLNEVLNLMADYAKKNNKSLMDMFSSVEAGNAALVNSGENSAQFTDNLNAMATEADLVGDAYDKVMNTFEEQSKKALNSLKNLGIGIYNDLKEPLKDSVKSAGDGLDKLNKSFSSGALKGSIKDLGTQVGNTAGKLLDFAVKAIPKVVSGLSWFLKNGKTIVSAIIGIKGAQLALNTATSAGSIIMPIVQKVTAAANLAQKAYAAGCTLSTSAQIGLSAALASTQVQMALVTGGLTLLIGGIAMLAMNSMTAEQATNELTEAANEQRQAWEELKEASKERAEESVLEIDLAAKYKRELDNLVDAEGNVIGNKDRVKFLIEEINKIMPDAIQLTKDQKVQYQESAKALDKLIEKKRAEAILEAYKDEYVEALNQEKELSKELVQHQKEMEEQQLKVNDAQKAYEEGGSWKRSERRRAYDEELRKLNDMEGAYNTNLGTLAGYYDSKNKYESASLEISKGNYAQGEAIINGYTDVVAEANAKSKEEWDKYLSGLEDNYRLMKLQHERGNKEITKEMVEQAKDKWEKASAEEWKGAAYAVNAASEGYLAKQPQLQGTIANVFKSSYAGVSDDQDVIAGAMDMAGRAIEDICSKTYNSQAAYENALRDVIYDSFVANKMNPELAKERADLAAKGIAEVAYSTKNNGNVYQSALKNVLLTSLQNNKVSPELAQHASDVALKAVSEMSDKTIAEHGSYEKAVEVTLIEALEGAGVDRGVASRIAALGGSLPSGVAASVSENQWRLNQEMVKMATGALNTALSILKINSPSKVFRDRVGKGIMEGISVGLDEGYKDTNQTLRQNMLNLAAEAQKQVQRDQYKWTHAIGLQANYRAQFGRPQWITNNNDNGVNQTLIFNKEVDSPAEIQRKLRYEAQRLAYQR